MTLVMTENNNTTDVKEAKRPRATFDTTEVVLRAIKVEAMHLGIQRRRLVSQSELLHEIVSSALAARIKELESDAPATEDKPAPRRKAR